MKNASGVPWNLIQESKNLANVEQLDLSEIIEQRRSAHSPVKRQVRLNVDLGNAMPGPSQRSLLGRKSLPESINFLNIDMTGYLTETIASPMRQRMNPFMDESDLCEELLEIINESLKADFPE